MKKPKPMKAPDPRAGHQPLYYQLNETCVSSTREDGEWGQWSREYSSTLKAVSRIPELLSKYSYEKVKVPMRVFRADNVYCVVVTYSDGDTFGHSSGQKTVAAITDDPQEAVAIRDQIDDGKDGWKDSPVDVTGGYCCWESYFCGVENVEVVFLPVMG